MAEEHSGFTPDMAGADTPQPPIDNIHNSINTEPDMPVQIPNEPQFHLPTMAMGEQLDTEMTEASVSSSQHLINVPNELTQFLGPDLVPPPAHHNASQCANSGPANRNAYTACEWHS